MRRRKNSEILEIEDKLTTFIWYHRCHLPMRIRGELDELEPAHRQSCLDAAERARTKYPEIVEGFDDFEWGMLNGKLSALRWSLGDEWDMLDT